MKKISYTIICIILLSFNSISQDILTARSQTLGSSVSITGIVTNGDELGPIRYVEDGTAGIAIYDLSTNNLLNGAQRGDSITITGSLVDYNGLLELNPTSSAIIHSISNSVTPQTVTPIQIGENTESELIQIDNVIFNNGGGLFTVGTHDFQSNGETGKIYIRTGHPLANSLIPMSPVTLVGLSSQYTFSVPANDGYQILPRDSADVQPNGNLLITSAITQSNISTIGFDLSWSTSDNATTECYYGSNPTNLTNHSTLGNYVINHTINFNNLSPATVYYVQCFSVNGIDTAFSNIGAYITSSNSTGKIRPYFNHSVDTSFSTGVNAQNITTYFNDTIKAYMDLAQNTLDICVYNASDATIASAINDAHNRGVQVRYIADDDASNLMLSSLDPNIPIVYRTNSTAGIMHNKFIIVDAGSVNNSWILSGSTNWTNPSNLFNDYNNLIFIQDQSLAIAYTLEFEEMWGSGPAAGGGVFGYNKEDNTPHLFNVNGVEIELYFSPTDQTTAKIIKFIDNVDYTMEFGLLSFTKNDIGDAVVNKEAEFGVNIRGIMEQENINGSEFDNLINNGVNVKSHTGVTHQFHHKYAITDANINGANPAVLTGSHNWSANAENNSDENTLIIHDATIANIYLQEFEKRWSELSPTTVSINNNNFKLDIFPNPSNGSSEIFSEKGIKQIFIYNIEGKLIKKQTSKLLYFDSVGTYFVKILFMDNSTFVQKIVNR